MNKIAQSLIAATAAIVLLAGCSSAPSTNNSDATDAPSDTPAPLVAESASPSANPSNAVFLEYVRGKLLPSTQIGNASDDQLLAAGHEACDQIRAGTDPGDVRVVEGEQPDGSGYYMDSSAIMNGALTGLCRDLL